MKYAGRKFLPRASRLSSNPLVAATLLKLGDGDYRLNAVGGQAQWFSLLSSTRVCRPTSGLGVILGLSGRPHCRTPVISKGLGDLYVLLIDLS